MLLANTTIVKRNGICPACGRRFGKHAVLTVAAWFSFGTPRNGDIVHWGCRFTPRPKRRPAKGAA